MDKGIQDVFLGRLTYDESLDWYEEKVGMAFRFISTPIFNPATPLKRHIRRIFLFTGDYFESYADKKLLYLYHMLK